MAQEVQIQLTEDEILELVESRGIDCHPCPRASSAPESIVSDFLQDEFDGEQFLLLVHGVLSSLLDREDVPEDVKRELQFIVSEAEPAMTFFQVH